MVGLNPRDLYGNHEIARGEIPSGVYKFLPREFQTDRPASRRGIDVYRGGEVAATPYAERKLYGVSRPSMPYERSAPSPAISTVPVPLHQAAKILLGK